MCGRIPVLRRRMKCREFVKKKTVGLERTDLMKRYLVIALPAGLALLLAACGRATPPPTAEATEAPVAVASPTASSPATPTSGSQAAVAQTTPETETQATVFPTPNPNPECVAEPIPEDPNIPPPAADEWSEGPDNAPLTLIEYSDFQ
jgi:hypothetical protein